jgi:hypothetical protein
MPDYVNGQLNKYYEYVGVSLKKYWDTAQGWWDSAIGWLTTKHLVRSHTPLLDITFCQVCAIASSTVIYFRSNTG